MGSNYQHHRRKGGSSHGLTAMLFVTIMALFVVGITVGACGVNPRKATAALEAQGLTDVRIGGYAYFGCGDQDTFRSSFTAKGANGQPVSGIVCSGLLKGMTVRYD